MCSISRVNRNAPFYVGIRILFSFLFFLFKFFEICSKEIEINLHSHSSTAACMGQFSGLCIAPAIHFLYILPRPCDDHFSSGLTSTSSLNTWTAVVCGIALCSCNLPFVFVVQSSRIFRTQLPTSERLIFIIIFFFASDSWQFMIWALGLRLK